MNSQNGNGLSPATAIATASQPGEIPSYLTITVDIGDREMVDKIVRYPAGEARNGYVLAALRVGLIALENANGHIDGQAVRDAGLQLIGDIRELLTARAQELAGEVKSALKQYFDPATGLVPDRIHSLVRQDGDLDRLLQKHLGPEDSVVAKTLAEHLGQGSPIFRMLSPTEANGLKAHLQQMLQAALAEQRAQVLKEFSLDSKDSALSRLVGEVKALQGSLKTDLGGQIDSLVKEFSLDHTGSALSRLVSKVEQAQEAIAAEFSSENDSSALNRLALILQKTNETVGNNLTLDKEGSALWRLRHELKTTIDSLVEKSDQFHADVRQTLSALQARRDEAQRSTTHGLTFEQEVGALLSKEAQRLTDVYEATGNTTGIIKNCKVGDHVIELGPESPAPGARIVWESKENKNYDVPDALDELERARKNREAQIGVFVCSRKCAPDDLQPLARYGDDVIVVWDSDDPSTDLHLRAAYSVARALAVRVHKETQHTESAVKEIEVATRAIEKQAGYLDEIVRWAQTIENNGRKIGERTTRMREDLLKQIETLDSQVVALKLG